MIIITGAWGGGSAKLHNWCLGLRGRSPITTNGDAENGDDQDDLGGGDDQEGHGEQSEGVVHILISPVATNGDAGDGDDQDGQDDHVIMVVVVVFIAMVIMVLKILMSILMSTITTNGDAGNDGQNDLGGVDEQDGGGDQGGPGEQSDGGVYNHDEQNVCDVNCDQQCDKPQDFLDSNVPDLLVF